MFHLIISPTVLKDMLLKQVSILRPAIETGLHNNLSDGFERHAIETGLHNVIFKVSLHRALWPLAKYIITSKMLHKKISPLVDSKLSVYALVFIM